MLKDTKSDFNARAFELFSCIRVFMSFVSLARKLLLKRLNFSLFCVSSLAVHCKSKQALKFQGSVKYHWLCHKSIIIYHKKANRLHLHDEWNPDLVILLKKMHNDFVHINESKDWSSLILNAHCSLKTYCFLWHLCSKNWLFILFTIGLKSFLRNRYLGQKFRSHLYWKFKSWFWST